MPPERSLVANRYQIISQLGEGNMGTVYRATDRLTGHVIALKQVRTGAADDETLSASDHDSVSNPLMSLANEFRTLASLRHPHVINVLDYGFHSDHNGTPTPYFTGSDQQPAAQGPDRDGGADAPGAGLFAPAWHYSP
jgi:serine/threonine protein kinase